MNEDESSDQIQAPDPRDSCKNACVYMISTASTCTCMFKTEKKIYLVAHWLSGRVHDSRPRGHGFEPHRRHCIVVLEQDTFILA